MSSNDEFWVRLRPESEADHEAVERLTRLAFWNLYRPGCDEHFLVHVLRRHPDCRSDLNTVAETDGRVIGHILYMRSQLVAMDDVVLDTLTFGPLSVLPEFQRRGVGKALLAHTIDRAKAEGCPAIVIFGNPGNYVSSGFRGCKAYGVGVEGGRHPTALLVHALRPEALAGRTWTFCENPAYQLDRAEAEAFDLRFPPLERAWRSSQEEYEILSHSFVE